MNTNFNNNTIDYTSADTVKKKPIGAIIGIGALVLVGASVLSYMFVPQVKNAVRLATLEPNEYIQTVAKDNSLSVAKAISEQYSAKNSMYNFEEGVSCEYNLSVDVSDKALDLLSSSILGENETLPDTLVTNYGAKGYVNFKGNTSKVDISLLANEETLISYNSIADMTNEKIYLQVPELSSNYLYITPQEDTAEDDYSIDYYDTFSKAFEKFSVNVNSIQEEVSAQEIQDTIVKYTNIIVDNLIGDTTLEKNVEGEVLSIEYKYNKLSTKISDSDFVTMGNQFVENLQSDEVVKTLIMSNNSITEEEYSEMINDLKDDIAEITPSEDYAILNTYVNSMGIICGFELLENENSTENVLSIMFANDNSDTALEFSAEDVSFTLSINEAEKDIFNGNMTFITSDDYSDDNITLSLNFDNVKTVDGVTTGNFSTDLSSLEVENLNTLTFDVSSSEKSQTVNMNVSDLVNISVTSNVVEGIEDIVIPSENLYDYNTQQDEYFENIADTEQLATDILTKVGLYDWYQEQISVYDDYSDYDYSVEEDYDYSDYDYEDFDDDYDWLDEDYEDFDEDYDYSDDDYEYANFDFNLINTTLNDETVILGNAPTEFIKSLPDYSEEGLTYYSDGLTFMASTVDDKITSVIVTNTSGSQPAFDFDINGVEIGDSYEKINETFGTNLTESSVEVCIYDINFEDVEESFPAIVIELENGRIATISLLDYAQQY